MNAIVQPMQATERQILKGMSWDLESDHVVVYTEDNVLTIEYDTSTGDGCAMNNPDWEYSYIAVEFALTCTEHDQDENETTIETPEWVHVYLAPRIEEQLEERAEYDAKNDY